MFRISCWGILLISLLWYGSTLPAQIMHHSAVIFCHWLISSVPGPLVIFQTIRSINLFLRTGFCGSTERNVKVKGTPWYASAGPVGRYKYSCTYFLGKGGSGRTPTHGNVFIHSLVFSLRGRVGRNQSPVMWPVWLWHTASWASSW